eukprot:NODE_20_length_44879_cov_0.624654.p23 type:complete len:241 gc:universal NODE_20_length_44879_cov_0.624654:33211-32489(-)
MDLEELKQIYLSGNTEKCYGINVDFLDIAHNNPKKAKYIQENGPTFKLSAIFPLKDFEKQNKHFIFPKTIYARITNLNRLYTHSFAINYCIGWICFSGTVLRCGSVQSLEKYYYFECSRCRNIIKREASPDLFNQADIPKRCNNLRDGDLCTNNKFKKIQKALEYIDFQEIKLQEHSHIITDKVPKAITVILQNDLIDSCQPGDSIMVTGHMRRRFKNNFDKIYIEWYIYANNVQVENAN